MIKQKIAQLIRQINPSLEQLKDDHCIIGSAAMMLSGLNVETINDMDLLVSHVDADKLKLLWSGKRRQDYIPENTRLFRSNFGRFDFGEIDVEVMGKLEVFKDDRWLPVTVMQAIEISFGEIKLKIPTLEEQHRIFLLFGRPKDIYKAKIIEDFLA